MRGEKQEKKPKLFLCLASPILPCDNIMLEPFIHSLPSQTCLDLKGQLEVQNKDFLVLKWRDVAAGKYKVLLTQNTASKKMASLYLVLQTEEFILT